MSLCVKFKKYKFLRYLNEFVFKTSILLPVIDKYCSWDMFWNAPGSIAFKLTLMSSRWLRLCRPERVMTVALICGMLSNSTLSNSVVFGNTEGKLYSLARVQNVLYLVQMHLVGQSAETSVAMLTTTMNLIWKTITITKSLYLSGYGMPYLANVTILLNEVHVVSGTSYRRGSFTG